MPLPPLMRVVVDEIDDADGGSVFEASAPDEKDYLVQVGRGRSEGEAIDDLLDKFEHYWPASVQ